MSDVLVAMHRLGGRAEPTQLAGQLGLTRSEVDATLAALAESGRVIVVDGEWHLVATGTA